MSFHVGDFIPTAPAGADRKTAMPAAAARFARRTSERTGPPPEVLDEVAAAAERAERLAAEDRELHFRTDEASGRIVIEVRDLSGEVIRAMAPSEALDVISGLADI